MWRQNRKAVSPSTNFQLSLMERLRFIIKLTNSRFCAFARHLSFHVCLFWKSVHIVAFLDLNHFIYIKQLLFNSIFFPYLKDFLIVANSTQQVGICPQHPSSPLLPLLPPWSNNHLGANKQSITKLFIYVELALNSLGPVNVKNWITPCIIL